MHKPLDWRLALQLGRVSNLPTVWSNVATGAVLAGQAIALPTLLVLLLALSLIYTAGMYLNDAFDRHIDAIERPERPIPAGKVCARTVFLCGFAMLATGVGLLATQGQAALLGGLLLSLTVLGYDLYHKHNPLSPLLMGLCRMLVYITSAASLNGGQLPPPVWLGAMALLAYLIGLTYTAKYEALGKVARYTPLLGLAVPMLYVLLRQPDPVTLLCLGAFVVWTGRCLWLALFRAQRDIRGAVGGLIAGISLNDAMLMAAHGMPWWALAGGGAFLLTTWFQRQIAGS